MTTNVRLSTITGSAPCALRRGWSAPALLLLLVACVGCTPRESLDTAYGKTGGTPGGKSVNGLSVLADMYEAAGCEVYTTNRFSPRLSQADTIVWAPDDFEPPSAEHREYLENWLTEGIGRTVVYIGRDYDATPDYWRQALPHAPPELAAEYHRRLAKAIADWNSERLRAPAKDSFAGWFKLVAGGAKRKVTTLDGPWADGVDASKTSLEITTRYAVPSEKDLSGTEYVELPEFEVLLSSQGEPLVIRVTDPSWFDGQILIVTNGSFLLNFPLVNKEHRKLAGKLVAESAYAGPVYFVESGPGGPPIRHREERNRTRTGFEMLTVWPLNVILLHTIFWLFLLCASLYPIFGSPRTLQATKSTDTRRASDLQSESTGDFGRHLTALGEMLSLTKDQEFALQKLQYYQQHVKRESGVSHVGPPEKTPASTSTSR